MITKEMLEDLKRSGLDKKDAIRMKVFYMDEDQTLDRTGFMSKSYVIPFPDLSGEVPLLVEASGQHFPQHWVARMLDSTLAKNDRYRSQALAGSRFYLPVTLDKELRKKTWKDIAADPAIPIWFTEGEKKSSRACKAGVACIGLRGVNGYLTSNVGTTKKEKGASHPIKDFDLFIWTGREVRIVFDSDSAVNTGIQRAIEHLSSILIGMGALPKTIDLPNECPGKTGIDDLLEKRRNDEETLSELEESAYSSAPPWHLYSNNFVYITSINRYWNIQAGKPLTVQDFIYGLTANDKKVMTVTLTGRPHLEYPGKVYHESKLRRSAMDLDYAPGEPQDLSNGKFNLWTNTMPEPIKGSIKPFFDLLDHHGLLDSGPTKDLRRWFLQWVGYPIRHIGAKMYSAVAIWSRVQGTGKTFLGRMLMEMYGGKDSHNVSWLQNSNDFEERFNTLLVAKQLIVGDEMVDDKYGNYGRVNGLITGEMINYRQMHIAPIPMHNHANFFLTSNSPNVVQIPGEDRRFFVFHTTEKALPEELRKRADDFLNNKTCGAYLRYYFEKTLKEEFWTGFNPKGAPPWSEDKGDVQESMKSEVAIAFDKLREHPELIMLSTLGSKRIPFLIEQHNWVDKVFDFIRNNYNPINISHAVIWRENVRKPLFLRAGQVRFEDGTQRRLWYHVADHDYFDGKPESFYREVWLTQKNLVKPADQLAVARARKLAKKERTAGQQGKNKI